MDLDSFLTELYVMIDEWRQVQADAQTGYYVPDTTLIPTIERVR